MNLKHIHYAWVTVIICFVIVAGLGFITLPFGILLKPITEEFAWGRGTLLWAVSSAVIVGGSLGILSGRLSDRFGPRPIITIGGLLCGAAFLLLSQITTLWHVYLILGTLLGVGTTFIILPIMPLVPRWFTKSQGIAMGITMAGFGLGGIVTPLVSQ